MKLPLVPHAGPLALNLNQPGSFVHWNIFNVSVANLVLILVMVVIFGVALLLPFPRVEPAPAGDYADTEDAAPPEDPGTARMWTYRLRRAWLRKLPPGKLLPDKQPAYVASWAYVFGVGSLAAFGVACVSGFALALGGPDWWRYNPVGHFFNSLHLWSVELFMALLVIHLWAKFWMAAWRGRRAMTWITGVAAFAISVVECFTGYVSQQNFDSQWISTSGKDAFNSVGAGAFFNVMNFGQMLMWHIVLVPLILTAAIGGHVLLVRVRGVSHPIEAHTGEVKGQGRARRRALAKADAAAWRGPNRRYDIIKEGTVASLIVLLLVVFLASLLSSPNEPEVSVASWSKLAPADFLATAASELNGTSETATYGPPYNSQSGSTQSLLFAPAKITGITQPVNAAQNFVLGPLTTLARTDPSIAGPLATYKAASPAQQLKWANAYASAVTKVKFVNGSPVVPAAADGPVPALLAGELNLARSGALDSDLIAQNAFYGTDFTKPLLFIEDGAYFVNKAQALGLTGEQWGVMNETGSYPGQPWLWLYTLWYQLPGFRSSANVDMIAIYMTGLATILLLCVPFIPGLRDVPRLIPVHKLVWRSYYRSPGGTGTGQPAQTVSGGTGPADRGGAKDLPAKDTASQAQARQAPPDPAAS
ncbi:MAG: cytochrome b N-terminal domain-containing protein [Streptosporangiaceae bacterium]